MTKGKTIQHNLNTTPWCITTHKPATENLVTHSKNSQNIFSPVKRYLTTKYVVQLTGIL